jgi:hypothetical protein
MAPAGDSRLCRREECPWFCRWSCAPC